MKNFILFILLFTFKLILAQTTDVCISDEESLYDNLNEISVKKCKIKATPIQKQKHYQKRRVRKNNFKEINYFSKSVDLSDKVKLNQVKNNITDIALSIKKTQQVKKNNTKIVSFSEVDKVPLFPSKQINPDAFDDFNEKITNHIDANLKYPLNAIIHKLKGIVAVNFTIDTNGNVINIKSSSENSKILEQESVRIISLLPKFIAGKHQGNNVNVSYSFQMEFHLDD